MTCIEILIFFVLMYAFLFIFAKNTYCLIKKAVIMKLGNFLFLFISAISIILTSCGSSKNAQDGVNPFGEAVVVDICQTMAEEKPQTRAFGQAEHFNMSTARNLAAMEARAEFSDRVASAVRKALEKSTIKDTQKSADDKKGAGVVDGLGVANEQIEILSKNVISNTMIIKTSTYYNKNKMYHVFVCVEYANGIDGMVKDITDGVKQQISDDKKIEMEFRIEEFRKSINEELENMIIPNGK